MVAITVIIAAMIGTFVFGVPQNIQKTKFMGYIDPGGTDAGNCFIIIPWWTGRCIPYINFRNSPQWNHLVYQQRRWRPDTEHGIFTSSR